MEISKMEFSDLISGYVKSYDGGDRFTMTTTDGRDYEVILGSNLYARLLRNLSEPYADATGQIKSMLKPGQMLFVYGIFYPNGKEGKDYVFEAKCIDFPGKDSKTFRFEEKDWWVKQAGEICDFFLRAQFPDGDINYDNYRTSLLLTGVHSDERRAVTILCISPIILHPPYPAHPKGKQSGLHAAVFCLCMQP